MKQELIAPETLLEDEAPIPYDETKDPDRFWVTDASDKAKPSQPGFISDLIYNMRGMEVPTLFTIWSALWLLSVTIKREAWLEWHPNEMFANLYIILTGPAGCKKSTTIDDVGMKILKILPHYIQDHNIKLMKNINIVKDKMTPESLLFSMVPENKPGKQSFYFTNKDGSYILDRHGVPIRYRATSETGIVLSEMASSVGKRSYTDGFIEILLDLYNPRDKWDWTTIGRGKQVLKNTYLSLLAATTPTGFKDSIPQAALGDGFLSRCVLVYQKTNKRRFSIPKAVKNGPTMEDLAKRLAWICEHSMGEYSLSQDAFHLYDSWYHQFRDYIEMAPEEAGFKSRMNINVLKVALLLRLNRYDDSNKIITKRDMEDSIALLNYTYARSSELLLGIHMGEFQQYASRVTSTLRNHKTLSRTELLRKTHIQADKLSSVLDHMAQEGLIIIKKGGKTYSCPSKAGNETYTLIGDLDDKED